MIKDKVFLGGTCARTTWRDELIPLLDVPYFNPVVDDWTPECQAIEEDQKEECGVHLYVLTSAMEGVFSVAEVVNSSHDKTKRTILHVIPDGFTEFQMKSLHAVVDMVEVNGATVYVGFYLSKTAELINHPEASDIQLVDTPSVEVKALQGTGTYLLEECTVIDKVGDVSQETHFRRTTINGIPT